MTDFLGHSYIFATLSLSLSLSGTNSQSHLIRKSRASAREYTAFLGTNQGKPACFLSLSDCNGGDGDRHKNNKHYYS